jgi:hypothetical protein
LKTAFPIVSKLERIIDRWAGKGYELVCAYVRGRPLPRRIICPRCGTMIDLSGERIFSLAPKKPTNLDDVRALFSAGELQMLEIEETSKAYAIKLKGYLGRKAFAVISDTVRLAGGHYFSAGKASKFIIPKEQQSE